MNKIIHFFDLDRTLWSVDARPWIIDKNNPSKPIIRLSKEEALYILSGIYKNDELSVNYNGKIFWISEDLLEKIQKKRKSLDITDIGISFTENVNPEFFNNVKIFVDNIKHLNRDDKFDIGILSARYSASDDKELLITLKEVMSNLGLEINKFFYINDYFTVNNTNKININKMKILLEHLVGFHIKDNHFEPLKQDRYDEVHFYDDEPQNINVANDIQSFLSDYLKKTEDVVFDRISERLSNNDSVLYTHLITNNSLDRFKTTKIELSHPIRFPIKLDEKKLIIGFDEFKHIK